MTDHSPTHPKRLKWLDVTNEAIIAALQTQTDRIPADCEIMVSQSDGGGCQFLLHSKRFPVVAEGAKTPHMTDE